jgi:hypothetical protein
MTQNVSIGINAQPDQAIEAFRKITEEAKRLGVEVKNISSMDMFPGLEDAKRLLREINTGFEQMFSRAISGQAAGELRTGAKNGIYGKDVVSWMGGVQNQFSDQKELVRHLKDVISQASRISAFGSNAGAHIPQNGTPAPPSGGMGLASMLPMAKGVLGLLGVGTGLAFAAKKVGDAEDEAVALTDLRRNVSGLDQDFNQFRGNIRAAAEGLGLTYIESVRLSKEYARIAGTAGSDATGSGMREGVHLARMFGLDASQGNSMMGRASWLGMGANPKESAKILAEAMAGSNLGGRQADAAEAMLRFGERSLQFLSDGGNTAGFAAKYLALINSDQKGIRNNAENILGGFDAAVRQGGHAGDAGKNFIYNTLAQHGISNPYDVKYALEDGFTGKLGEGKMIGPELIGAIRSRYGSDPKNKMMLAAMSGLFGGSMHHAEGALKAFDDYKSDPAKLAAKIGEIEADLKKGDLGAQARLAAADVSNTLTSLIGDRLLPVAVDSKKFLEEILGTLDAAFPGYRQTKERNAAEAAWSPMAAAMADGTYRADMEHTQQDTGFFGASTRASGRARAELSALNMKRGMKRLADSPQYMKFLSVLDAQNGLRQGTMSGIMGAESAGGHPDFMRSEAGALGPFQMMEAAAKEMGVKDRMDPFESATGAAGYLAAIRKRHPEWSEDQILTAYHSGEGNVSRNKIGPMGAAYAKTVHQHMQPAGTAVHVTGEVTVKDSKGNAIGRAALTPSSRINHPSILRQWGQ